jgi:hypothetical protein
MLKLAPINVIYNMKLNQKHKIKRKERDKDIKTNSIRNHYFQWKWKLNLFVKESEKKSFEKQKREQKRKEKHPKKMQKKTIN